MSRFSTPLGTKHYIIDRKNPVVPRPYPRIAPGMGTPGFSLSMPALSPPELGIEPGISANQLVFAPASCICEGVRMLCIPRDQNMLYRESLPGMGQDRCQEVEWA